MKCAAGAAAALLAAAWALAGCKDGVESGKHTAVLGSNGPSPAASAPAALTDGQGQPIPAPTFPGAAQAQVVRAADANALAVWVQDGHVLASSFDRAQGWSAPQPLEQIYGEASDPRLASNGQGQAIALWRHTVGSIESLRYSHYAATSGWSAPDVVPGALPRPHVEGAADHDAPQLAMDAQGSVTARWPSGFDPAEEQVARYVPGEGWSRAVSERLASAPPASAARPAPSSPR